MTILPTTILTPSPTSQNHLSNDHTSIHYTPSDPFTNHHEIWYGWGAHVLWILLIGDGRTRGKQPRYPWTYHEATAWTNHRQIAKTNPWTPSLTAGKICEVVRWGWKNNFLLHTHIHKYAPTKPNYFYWVGTDRAGNCLGTTSRILWVNWLVKILAIPLLSLLSKCPQLKNNMRPLPGRMMHSIQDCKPITFCPALT